MRVGVGDRDDRDLQDRRSIGDGQPLGVLGRADAGGQRIAGEQHHVGDRAALDSPRRPGGPVGIGDLRRIAVVPRVGVDDAADCAVVLRQLRLQAAPALAVAGDDDLALDVDPHPLERLVVVGHAVVDVDQGRGDVAVALISDVGGQRGLGRARSRVARDRRLLQRRLERARADELEGLAKRRRIEHFEGLDVGVPAEGLELGQLPFGVGLVVRRADVVGLGRHQLHPGAEVGRLDRGVQGPRQAGLVRRRRAERRSAGQQRCRGEVHQ